ncbi:MAG: amino acid adenylation domain-containing protein [Pseudomonadales bacterium]|nr:amino acid adenylation domain-containing protein [Pseudomonadales bacterium]
MSTEEFDPFAGGEILRVSSTTGPQQEIIASAQMSDVANTAFNEAVSLTVKGSLDLLRLEACFDTLIERHDILRATFSRRGDELCLQETRNLTIDFEDLRSLDETTQKLEIADLWQNIAISPMNLEEGPLLFVWLKQLEADVYELIIVVHHIVCDGWSLGLLLNQLSELYRGDPNKRNEAASFFDFAEQQDAAQIANTDIDFWREKFRDLPSVLDLPLDWGRPQTRPFQAARFDYAVSPELAKALPKAAAGFKASLVNLIMASYFALLNRLTQNEDIVVGLPIAGQVAMKQLSLVGHMVQLLPIRVSLDGETSFVDLVTRVKEEVLTASEHPNFTFGKLLEGLVLDRSRVPLISSIFNIDQAMPPLDFGEASATLRTVPRAAESFEVFLNVVPSPDTLVIEATYSTALFCEETIKTWLMALESILETVIANPQVLLNDIVLTKAVPPTLLKSNDTEYPVKCTDVISAFRQRVKTSPDALAIVSGESRLSYAELDNRSNQYASYLAAQGIVEGSVVGLCCERNEKMLLSVFAILKLGAAYLPLDPDFPADRLIYMLEDSDASFVIEDSSAPKGIRDASVTHIDLDTINLDDRDGCEIDSGEVDPDRLAYTIYTSGSTGKPKGILVPCSAMINFLESMAREPGCEAGDRLLAVTTLSFDISVLELFLPLISGATTVIASRQEVKDGEKLANLIAEESVTIVQATPATWRILLASDWGDDALKTASKIRTLCGGEALPIDLVDALLPRSKELWNMFGPTETTVWSSCKRITSCDEVISVGKAIANTQLYILDAALNPLPLSVPGEICIAGKGVTLGYHNLANLTGDRFVDHPEWGRLYRTGDLGKTLPNGEIQHLGRLDDQVKVRGYRIELGEIEQSIVSIASVQASAVYLWEPSPLDVRIVACCVPAENESFQTIAIRKRLRELLPGYMVPQYLLSVDELPLLPNGKLNRKALPKPELNASTLLSKSGLDSPLEKTIASIWTDLIKPENAIGRDDRFFDIGGHSLLALESIRRIDAETGFRLTPAEIVAHPLSVLAERIANNKAQERVTVQGPVALSSTAVRDLSNDQERMLRRQLDFPETTCHNLPAAWLLEGDLQLSAFRKSIERVFEYQTALRTVVVKNEGGYHLQLKRMTEIAMLEVVDVSDSVDPLATATADAEQVSATAFEPINSLLCRVRLYKLAEQKHCLLLVPHQLIFDGWSFDIFLNNLEAFYLSSIANTASSISQHTLEYRDYAHWSRQRKVSDEVMHFHQSSASEEVATMPLIRSKAEKGGCQRQVFNLSRETLQNIELFCDSNELRVHEVLFAAFAKSLSDQLETSNVALGLPVTGRYSAEVIGLIGGFVSTVPCKLQIPGDGFVASLKNIVAQLSEFQRHEDITFADIVENTGNDKKGFVDFVPVSFGFQDVRTRPSQLAELVLRQIDIPRLQTEYPVEFWTRIQPDGLLAVFDYDSAQVDDCVIEILAASFEKYLAELDPAVKVLDVTVEKEKPEKTGNPEGTKSKKSLWRRLFQ